MRRVTGSLLAALVLGAVLAAAITMGSAHAGARSAKKTTLTVWVGWSARELRVFKGVVADYAKKHPELNIKVVGSINDTKITNAIRAGNAPDVVSSFTSAMVGVYCGKGAWIDLKPFLSKDHVSLSQFPKTSLYYTQFKGKRCALPLLADSYGLYYNKTLFAKAGIKAPPKTFSELTADAKKLTQRSADGKIEVAGYVPTWGFYENQVAHYAPQFDAHWTDDQGKSSLSTDPGWKKMQLWNKKLVDWYGYDNLVKFQAGAGDGESA